MSKRNLVLPEVQSMEFQSLLNLKVHLFITCSIMTVRIVTLDISDIRKCIHVNELKVVMIDFQKQLDYS